MVAPLSLLDLARLFFGFSVLAFSAFTDWKWRRAPNVLWTLTTLVGLLLLGVQAAVDPAPLAARWPYLLALPTLLLLASEASWADAVAGALALVGVMALVATARLAPGSLTAAWPYLLALPLFGALVYAMWYFGLIAGGADAKALISFGVLLPFPLAPAGGLPFWGSPLPGSVVLLEDSLVVFLVVPLGMLAWNAAHGDVRLPHAFLGVKRRAADVRRGHAWPMETVDEAGKRRTRFFASRMAEGDIDATFERVQALGDERVWVSPKVPFLVPMLVGLLVAFLVGDLIAALVRPLVS